jgi:muconolactone delta-isomerase
MPKMDEAAKLLPDRVGEFHVAGDVKPVPLSLFGNTSPEEFGVVSAATRTYQNGLFKVTLLKMRSDSHAYALLTEGAHNSLQPRLIHPGYVGTAGFDAGNKIVFFKGTSVVIAEAARSADNHEALLNFARLFAETMDRGEGEIPVLVKHLPDWEHAQERATYAVSLAGLERVLGNQPILEAISFEGGAEAVTANYGQSRMVIVEHTTPQIASDTDARIQARIRELQAAGQPVPSAYRRVGNYSVFVFNAPDGQTATQLIDQVSYEQVVQWLGMNPHILERAQREYVNTMGGTILAVLKASGLSLIVCGGLGALAGAWIFKRRRAQAAAVPAYSDAGGMLRLNLDEMSSQTDSTRLLGRGEG